MGTVVITQRCAKLPAVKAAETGPDRARSNRPDVPQCRADAVGEHVPVPFGERLEAA